MAALKAVWKWLEGKKSKIGAIAGCVLAWAQARGYITDVDAMAAAGVLTVWVGMAITISKGRGVQ